ncbi:hypothetical protein HYR99_34710 [Candidatus Poribacteria bacterium]|nr:hypothetical protein [Candidatus Poribacteria bacterium]
MKTIRIVLLLLMLILIFADPAESQSPRDPTTTDRARKLLLALAESQPPRDPAAPTQEDLRQSIDNLTKVTADLTRVVNTLAKNSQSVKNPNTTENWLRIVVPIILAIIGAVAWVNRKMGKIEGFEEEFKTDIQNLREDVQGLRTELTGVTTQLAVVATQCENMNKSIEELKTDVRDLKTTVHDLDKGLQTVMVQIKNTDKWIEDIKMDIREIRSEISLLRGQKPGDMPKIEGES